MTCTSSACAYAVERIDNPYADVSWNTAEYVHSFSHQHGRVSACRGYGRSPELFWDMGFRHLPFSDYYSSKPFYPLPEAFVSKHPDAIGAPNAEHHSLTDARIHFNAPGSLYTTGYGCNPGIETGTSPIEYVFDGLIAYDSENTPWRGIYRLDIRLESPGGTHVQAGAFLTVTGAIRVDRETFETIGDGLIRDLPLTDKPPTAFYLKTQSDRIRVKINFDPASTGIKTFRLMQGINRPWRDAFRAALDGTLKDGQGNRIEGLLYPDGGGITINHPTCGLKNMLTYLDFDERVLGIEVWNDHHAFGGFPKRPETRPFYDLWDDVLQTGRRCFGFFVKDHLNFGRGRNVLLMPDLSGLTAQEKEREALRAYRQGRFFGLLGAMSVDDSGKVVPPYDYSAFRFACIAVRKNKDGKPSGVEVEVAGADKRQRPNTQIRFVTDQGVAHTENNDTAFFSFLRDSDDRILCKYVRVEAFSYPNTHLCGQPLSCEAFSKMNVTQIATLHDKPGDCAENPIGIVDMLFSQPILTMKNICLCEHADR